MIHLYDLSDRRLPASIDASVAMQTLLSDTLARLSDELLPFTEIVLVQPHDTERDLYGALGYSPLIDPIDGHRWPDALFQPCWDWIGRRNGTFQLNVSFGSTFGQIILVEDAPHVFPQLLHMCRAFMKPID